MLNKTMAFATGNLISRNGMTEQTETLLYDDVDRLIAVQQGGATTMSMDYILNSRPHAVNFVENTEDLISYNDQSITYTAFNKVSSVRETVGADNGDYEVITENGVTRQLYYLGGSDGLSAIYVKQSGQADKLYYACKDHLGSIVKLVDGNGTEVFKASYDAWGRQTISNSTFLFYRGYTGHEHLPELGLINMNGRMYDPILGRFLSPDPFVQMPDFSQSFNRYTYCLNNPLIYTDPNGEWFGIDDLIAAVAGFVYNYLDHGISTGNWGWDAVKTGLIGAGASWLSYNTLGGYSFASNYFQSSMNFDFRSGSNQSGMGINFSVGTQWNFPVNYTAHSGAYYFWENEDLMGNDLSGWETRYGSEWSVPNAFSYSGTVFNSSWSGQQTTNLITVGNSNFNIKYENDMEPGGIFNAIPFVPKGDGDRYQTAAAQINIGPFGIGTNMMTGDPGPTGNKQYDPINGKDTYVAHDGYDPNSHRMGTFYFKIGPFRFGRNSEGIRKVFQNQFAHDFLTGGESKWFEVLNLKSRWYWGYGYSGGSTLW